MKTEAPRTLAYRRKFRLRKMYLRILVVDGLGLVVCLIFLYVLLLCWWQMFDPRESHPILSSALMICALLLPFWGFWFLVAEALDRLRRTARLIERTVGGSERKIKRVKA